MVSQFKKNKKASPHTKHCYGVGASPRQNLFFSILLAVSLLLVVGFLVVTNWRISQRRVKLTSRITDLKQEIQILAEKNERLKGEISQAGSKESLEKAALEQLGLKPSGTEVVVVTKETEEEKKVEEKEKGFWNPQVWWEWIRSKVRD